MNPQNLSLSGKAALITGASRGLGAALARELSRRGARLALVARDAGPLDEVARSIHAAGGAAHAIAANVGDKQAAHAITGAAAALVGPIDVLVHNASTLGPTPLRLLLDTKVEDLERVLAVNLVGPFRLSKIIAGSMALRGRGVIVHLSSDAAVHAYPRWGAYGISKAALDHLARTWAAELEGSGVHVISVDPGEMNTRMHAEAIPDADPATLADPAIIAARIADMIERAHQGGAIANGAIANGARVEASTWSAL